MQLQKAFPAILVDFQGLFCNFWIVFDFFFIFCYFFNVKDNVWEKHNKNRCVCVCIFFNVCYWIIK
jgi:hypothetical protein